ncbi:MAG: hypothetical protein DRN15_01430 [Thermoprotei archaeon]|nr:MAG: hypothetical protein DRN15_01430 [Thermoprotei archaeon]RLF25856.1 MAG: hypothetical protein DRM97_00325 [Thermoprotei archaeon]
MKCAICNREDARHICLRCRRDVCDGCYDETLMLCRDCISFKVALEEDVRRRLDYFRRLALNIRDHARASPTCARCPILREMCLTLVKWIKDYDQLVRRELLVDVEKDLKQVKTLVYRVAAEALIRQGLSLKLNDKLK